MRTRSRLLVLVVAAAVALSPLSLSAHEGAHAVEALNFNRPEAWALKYFTSATLFSGLETPRTRNPWSVSFGVEIGWLKPVSPANRFVGFNGTKQEDLNKAPVFARPRVAIGLPARLTLLVGVDPPLHTFGITPRLLAFGLERPVYESEPWTLGLRATGQVGTVEGAYACPSSVLAFAPGSVGNVYGCNAESSDTASLRYVGGEFSVAHQRAGSRWSPHAAFGVNYMSVGFHVDAVEFGEPDHTQYTSRGVTVSGSAGLTLALTGRLNGSLDAFYTPLPVLRGGQMQNDGFFNIRALMTYRIH
ncbi:MAG: hypothetical protein ACM3NQ_07470 [Bacteroidales bacterium]